MNNFETMDLFAPLKRALAEQNYTIPTAIQAQTIPAAINGQDILGCAQTGTGKTAAFALPILDYLGHEEPESQPNRPTALVLAPTRELAIQIGESFRVYGKHMKFRQALVYGGVGQGTQVNALNRGVHVLVATPGRLLDLMNQGHVDLRNVEILVLDEADRMLGMGFLPDLKKIIAKIPEERQSLFFSATLPPKIREFAATLLFNPVSVNVTPKRTSVELIEQKVRMIKRDDKVTSLSKELKSDACERAIVFTRTKHGANALAKKLERDGIQVVAIHGNKSQNARQKALEAFRQKEVTVLVATDVAARGIDIDGVSHVINFDMPVEPESYVHRIGRTGRAGADGIALSFCTADERDELHAIESFIGARIRIENPNAQLDAVGSSGKSKQGNWKSKRGPQAGNSSTKKPYGAKRPFRRGKKTGKKPQSSGRRTANV